MISSTTTARVYRIEKLGGLEGLVSGFTPIPTAGPGEVLVRVRASSLNYRDIIILDGNYFLPVPAGRIPLSDAAGEIVAIGPDVTRFSPGDRVTNSFIPEWLDGPYTGKGSSYSADTDGWLTDYRVVQAEALIPIPDDLGFEEAATLPCAGVTAWSALKGVLPSDTVLTQGSGGVSLFAIQLAKAMGARVIATTSSDKKIEQIKALGADEIINYKTQPEWSQRVRELTAGKGADRIIEVGGPGTFEQSVKAIAIGGQVSMVGALAGMQGGVEFMAMFLSQARYQPIVVGSRQDLEDLLQCVTQHAIRPCIDSTWDFDDAKLGFERLAGRNVFGKVVVKY
ncbi:zinc-dependent alcohol dehydrogenase family protein [Pectobacterium versatile]|uniref:zinc-dependent alcohol dehydrogenase family protein n=1 Tax=Pectobacterium versatile TaxID=2488639 RepID=UPI001CCE085E|nr:NAD(P)-dependent alcohol dehydrogenase [Pectobacterium versatile]